MENIVDIPIKDYLNEIGIPTRKEGNRYFASSPFSRDSNWSFCIYPTNTFFDFSSGHGGNIINLVARIDGTSVQEAAKKLRQGISHEKYKPNYKRIKEQLRSQTPFDYEKYINTDPEECKQIKAYAASRGITEGYFCGVFFTRVGNDFRGKIEGKWIRVPALGFLHVDKDLKPCGTKFRKLVVGQPKDQSPRFSARGQLGLYLLDGLKVNQLLKQTSPALYVVESESSANSLFSWKKGRNEPCVILSRGGVASVPKLADLPEEYQVLPIKLIIDYDGNEELYQQRLLLYKDLNAEPIKLILPKGEDINSLYCKNEMWKIEKMLL
jgi:hypothetical protein